MVGCEGRSVCVCVRAIKQAEHARVQEDAAVSMSGRFEGGGEWAGIG